MTFNAISNNSFDFIMIYAIFGTFTTDFSDFCDFCNFCDFLTKYTRLFRDLPLGFSDMCGESLKFSLYLDMLLEFGRFSR